MSARENPPTRLLFVITTSDFGGTESFLERLVSGLDRERFEVSICSLCPPGRIGKRLAKSGITVHDLGMGRRAKPLQMAVAMRRLARLLRDEQIELVQALLYRANVLAAVARRWSRADPILVTGQRSLIPKGRSLDFRAQRFTRSWADRVVAVSEAVRAELLETESVDPTKVVVIQNGIELERFHLPEPDERQRARDSWDLPYQALVIGAVGRLHGPKGIEHLIEALALARLQRPDLELVLAGDGPELDVLRRRARQLDLEAHVHFLGYRRDPRPLYPGFDIYALPSLAEGSPNALLEAMGRGCACVASAVGGVPEAIIEGESGLLVPPAKPEALATALLKLAADPQLRERLATAARQRVEAHFDIRQMIDAHEELYTELLAERR